ncbi:hypothetical protein IC614_01520 [Allosphingosinicella flava]|uniref:Uncharacterized protein n=1 Tax=Allosphingosinicella flava TaxID=2771430 RepID=A0A7T2GK43_9SPHN|nr:hypothetical protein [Sphingosinicella flava]QPQ55319.1 hypothetical protein IC614_01520 [Sphingosinicella flava]
MTKIDISSVPEIRTPVGIHSSSQQREVAGAFCVGGIIAVAILIFG